MLLPSRSAPISSPKTPHHAHHAIAAKARHHAIFEVPHHVWPHLWIKGFGDWIIQHFHHAIGVFLDILGVGIVFEDHYFVHNQVAVVQSGQVGIEGFGGFGEGQRFAGEEWLLLLPIIPLYHPPIVPPGL